MSRNVSAHLFSAVNGVVEAPNTFQFDAFGPEEMELMGRAISGATDVVLGRTLWQEWSEYWPSAAEGDPFAAFINPVRKHVISSTLEGDPGWNSTVVGGEPVRYLQSLKDGDGGNILVAGGIETVRSLFLAGVVDTLTLTVHPAVGEGRRLFDETVPTTRLELVDSAVTSAGNAVLTYRLRSS
ncbi:dihydrofolate reductase family protein [Pedococcus sp. 5OH_020]|uniref:dihydrofolate reductase family protein n=1 Tax=Pedococcus sp. 5OH_020 TaxID=2989814 RepID=UPI0022E9B395|nr:dihydrofolate reductase family protein [Pedococcus sp. 5OH_020]